MPLPDSEIFNIEFVRTIETCRCLYDVSLPEYSSKDEQDEAWNIIAAKFSATAPECKLRWKYLRGGLTRYIKKLKETRDQGDKQIKQFYMWDDMQFVIPYLKTRAYNTGSLITSDPGHDIQEPYEIKCELDDVEDSDCVEDSFIEFPKSSLNNQEVDPTSSPSRGIKRTIVASTDKSTDTAVSKCKATKFLTNTENPDLDFFKSILPDIAELNASQKRRFKLKVLMLLEEMCSEGKNPARSFGAASGHSRNFANSD
ncbi:transcription factor Adf-1 [Elysia marginata]|uniref:Transcription factor Adf-1 n=1 Tax=Elysia marginata TaxID=1093978 RepID=A0AAV4FLX3_9GAST|nr:transcription factor Adf-1 [Elysia marginata]